MQGKKKLTLAHKLFCSKWYISLLIWLYEKIMKVGLENGHGE